jgi:PPE-repeat protein
MGVMVSAATGAWAASGAGLTRGGFAAGGFAAGGFAASGFAASGFAATGFAAAGFVAAGFAAATLGLGLLDFTVTFGVAMGMGLAGGLATFFLGAAALVAAFLGVAFPGRFAALLGFFEGIVVFRLLTKERAIIPTQSALYRPKGQHICAL